MLVLLPSDWVVQACHLHISGSVVTMPQSAHGEDCQQNTYHYHSQRLTLETQQHPEPVEGKWCPYRRILSDLLYLNTALRTNLVLSDIRPRVTVSSKHPIMKPPKNPSPSHQAHEAPQHLVLTKALA